MDQICQNESDSSGFQQYLEGQFDMLLQEFHEFQQKSLLPPPHPINPSSGHSEPPPQATTQQHFTTLLQDFEEFGQAILPPNQMGPIYVQNMNNIRATRNFDTDGPYYSTQNLEATNACVGAGGTVVGSFTRNANITTTTTYSNGGGSGARGGTIMDSVLKLANLSTCGICKRGGIMMGSFIKCGFSVQGLGVKVKGKDPPRRRKRKYRGVYETEAQFILRMERQKIKNRETAARSFENKQAYEAHLLAQVQKLRQRNKFLKKLLVFLENPRINLPRKPLKRTISGPI